MKIIDFGLSAVTDTDQCGNLITGAVGSQIYSAPEVYYNKELYSSQGYRGEPADVWSCAVTLYIMLTGKQPFKRPLHKTFGLNPNLRKCTYFSNLINGYYPARISPLAKDLMKKMFQIQPGNRLSIQEILEHPWCQESIPNEEYVTLQMQRFAERSWAKQGKFWLSEKIYAMSEQNISIIAKSEFPIELEQKYIESMFKDTTDFEVGSPDGTQRRSRALFEFEC